MSWASFQPDMGGVLWCVRTPCLSRRPHSHIGTPPALQRLQVLSPRILKTLASNSHLLLLFPLSLRYEMHCWLWIWDVGEQATLAPVPTPRQCRNDANQSVLAHHPFGPSSSSSSASQPICFRKIQGRGAHPCQVPRPLDWTMSPFQQFRA